MMRSLGRMLATAALLGLPLGLLGADQAGHWSYQGDTGPARWGELSAEFATCATGQAQSPINIGAVSMGGRAPLHFRYRTSPLVMVNNGHTLQVDYAPGSSLVVGDKTYELKQFHFHTPSEHTRNGIPVDMVAHLVHQAADGELAVVAVMMVGGRSPHPELARIWRQMPTQANSRSEPAHIYINLARLLPGRRDYFTYTGSLTTPPCTEGVRWFVLDTPVEVSRDQVARFHDLFGDNARPIQPLHMREIVYVH